MKALIVLTILITLVVILLKYKQDKNLKKLFISLGTFTFLILLGISGNITRQIIPLFLLHIVLLIGAWSGLLVYIFRAKYYWQVIFTPVVTIVLFLILELLTGSAHEFPIMEQYL